jgi:hypothetical protein
MFDSRELKNIFQIFFWRCKLLQKICKKIRFATICNANKKICNKVYEPLEANIAWVANFTQHPHFILSIPNWYQYFATNLQQFATPLKKFATKCTSR